MGRLHYIPRPEGGEGVDVVYNRHHGCPNAGAFRKALDEPDCDLVVFNISSHGGGMPLDTPFPVMSTNPCRVCGTYLKGWFAWSGRQIFTM